MVTRWVAPFSGTISVNVPFSVISVSPAPDPVVRVAIQVNDNNEIFNQSLYNTGDSATYSGKLSSF
jgi:hypothetical protein